LVGLDGEEEHVRKALEDGVPDGAPGALVGDRVTPWRVGEAPEELTEGFPELFAQAFAAASVPVVDLFEVALSRWANEDAPAHCRRCPSSA
jgi:hypothetical protein